MSLVLDILKRVQSVIPTPADLHTPNLSSLESEKVAECLESTFVSSVGAFTNKVEEELCKITKSPFAIVTSTGTSALHLSLHALGVGTGDLVLVPNMTFVATANAVLYTGAKPLFIDIETESLGVCPLKLADFLKKECSVKNDLCVHNKSNAAIKALCVVHVFGFAAKLSELLELCKKYKIHLVEDSAESLGSYYKKQHTGTLGTLGTLSFNGNKIATAGGGGAILCSDPKLAQKIKHLSTTAKIVPADKVSFSHDVMGFNYRMPNLNAALLYAQLLRLPEFLEKKKLLHKKYLAAFSGCEFAELLTSHEENSANYWLNTLILKPAYQKHQKELLTAFIDAKIQARPPWDLMNTLAYLKESPRAADLSTAESMRERIINLPSSSQQKTL